MTAMLKEFRDFALRGNLVELAVALVMALAFKQVITSLVDHVLMPIVGIIVGEPSFDGLDVTINDSIIYYGSFVTNLVDFVIVAAAIFFFVVKPYNSIRERRAAGDAGEEAAPEPEELQLLRQIAANTARAS